MNAQPARAPASPLADPLLSGSSTLPTVGSRAGGWGSRPRNPTAEDYVPTTTGRRTGCQPLARAMAAAFAASGSAWMASTYMPAAVTVTSSAPTQPTMSSPISKPS